VGAKAPDVLGEVIGVRDELRMQYRMRCFAFAGWAGLRGLWSRKGPHCDPPSRVLLPAHDVSFNPAIRGGPI